MEAPKFGHDPSQFPYGSTYYTHPPDLPAPVYAMEFEEAQMGKKGGAQIYHDVRSMSRTRVFFPSRRIRWVILMNNP